MRPADLRRAVKAHLAEELPEWRTARVHPDLFPLMETRQFEHRTYAVGVMDSEGVVPRDRQVLGRGAIVSTTIYVRTAVRLRADAVDGDIDRALDLEAEVVAALGRLKARPVDPIPLRIERVTAREATEDGLVQLAEIQCAVEHFHPLEA